MNKGAWAATVIAILFMVCLIIWVINPVWKPLFPKCGYYQYPYYRNIDCSKVKLEK